VGQTPREASGVGLRTALTDGLLCWREARLALNPAKALLREIRALLGDFVESGRQLREARLVQRGSGAGPPRLSG
jgi:hypothetical protein